MMTTSLHRRGEEAQYELTVRMVLAGGRTTVIRLSEELYASIGRHGAKEFPLECVGAMLGEVEGDVKIVRELRPLANHFEASPEFEAADAQVAPGAELPVYGKERRFQILPADMFKLMQEERRTRQRILGFYHSHPNHPARPSQTDLKAAHAWYTYIIVSILDGKPDAMTAWRLNPEHSSFVEEELTVLGGS
jgi:proteasome lid subunit RPN8/RPN11